MMYDELWPGGPKFKRTEDGFPLSTDSVLLAHFVRDVRAKTILDLGCGAGVLTVLLHVSHPRAGIGGIELRERAAAVCRENLAVNGFDPAGVLTGDLRKHRTLFPAGRTDLVVSNPPYFPVGHGDSSPDPDRAGAREERECALDDLCAAAGWLCRWGGAFALVHRPERLSEICCAMTAHGLEPKRLRMVQHRAGAVPSLVLIEGRRGGKPGLQITPPLILCGPDGEDTDEAKEIYHRGS